MILLTPIIYFIFDNFIQRRLKDRLPMNTEKMEERLLGERLQELEEGQLAEAIEAAIKNETELMEETFA